MDRDKQAFWARMFATNEPALRGFLRRHVAHTWDIQDLAQEAYLRMLRVDAKRAGSIANPKAYLFTVASNLIKEHAVVQRRDALGVDAERVLECLEAPDGTPEDETARVARRQRVERTLARLPPRCRAVLVMQHRDGMSYREIADAFGVSTNMVKKYVVRALLLCRSELVDKE